MAKNWRNSKEWKHAKEKALKRDNYTCQICGDKNHLVVHHINDASYHRDQRYDLDNLVTLCYDCHRQFHTNFKRSYRQKCTKYDWDNFKELTNYYLNKSKKG